jgi:tetratricopeptide (TPR) repeat protein
MADFYSACSIPSTVVAMLFVDPAAVVAAACSIILFMLPADLTAFSPKVSVSSFARSNVCLSEQANNKNKKDHLTASKRERRDEDVRRSDRQQDAVPGKTSAIPGAKDYALNPIATTQEWMKHASRVEQQVYQYTEQGMRALTMFQLQDASDCFDQVFELRPMAYLWQAGIPKYYLGDYVGGATIMTKSAQLAETKFGLPASEERIWRDACQIKYNRLMKSSFNNDYNGNDDYNDNDNYNGNNDYKDTSASLPLFPPLPSMILPSEEAPETRKAIRIAKELFSATIQDDPVALVLARAKLRAICSTPASKDWKLWKLSSWFYLGLHYDAIGDDEQSKECMKMALRTCPNANGNDIIHALPMLHMSVRDWFDDDAFDEDDDSSGDDDGGRSTTASSRTASGSGSATTDQVVMASIRQSVSEMKVSQLQDALKLRGLKYHGIKDDLQRKLALSLCDDLGLERPQ